MERYLYILVSIIFLGWCVSLLKAKSSDTGIGGFLKADGAVMNIEDVVSVWSENERLLTLYLFPFELSEQDIQIVVSDSLFSYVCVLIQLQNKQNGIGALTGKSGSGLMKVVISLLIRYPAILF